jgi:hypothetical protein
VFASYLRAGKPASHAADVALKGVDDNPGFSSEG